MLARDYNVAHTTLSRYFARPAVARRLVALTFEAREPEAARPLLSARKRIRCTSQSAAAPKRSHLCRSEMPRARGRDGRG